MSKTKKRQQAARERVAAMKTQQRRAERRRNLITIAAIVVVAAAAAIAVVLTLPSGGGGHLAKQVIPPVPSGKADVLPAAVVVPNTSGIRGVVAYDTTGWPTASHNGPAKRALGHAHATGPVTYSVTPPVGGDHNGTWLNCGTYSKPVPSEYAVHNLEHGAVWITYRPSLPQAQVTALRDFVERQSVLKPGTAGSRYMDLTPFSGLPSPIVVSSWGFQLRLTSPTDPRLQQFVNKFRVSSTYSPEFGAPCTGGTGTPLKT